MDLVTDARERMVAEQIVARGVRDVRVLAAMRSVPREAFVATAVAADAYLDSPLPIGWGQTISQPYMAAIMTQALSLPVGANVLEIGTGSGYQAAVLSMIASRVVSIERHAPLAAEARERLVRLGYLNVEVIVADGSVGWPAASPYDGVIVTAGAPSVPDALRWQLADGGRLVIPVGDQFLQRLTVVSRRGGHFEEERHFTCAFVPLVGAAGWPEAPGGLTRPIF
ncbi:MAG TPA: protein-L-isoaspartate(D-aspartate) O-methyltransferase [Vicinamibacterales bacterium]|nr:protein-L-isoaspartate(D-aspartate) O-methyltransferase [Vicinamibacterales bacterium]